MVPLAFVVRALALVALGAFTDSPGPAPPQNGPNQESWIYWWATNRSELAPHDAPAAPPSEAEAARLLAALASNASAAEKDAAVIALGACGSADAIEPLRAVYRGDAAGLRVFGNPSEIPSRSRALAAFVLATIAARADNPVYRAEIRDDLIAFLAGEGSARAATRDLRVATVIALGLVPDPLGRSLDALDRYFAGNRHREESICAHVPAAIARQLQHAPTDVRGRYAEDFASEISRRDRAETILRPSFAIALGMLTRANDPFATTVVDALKNTIEKELSKNPQAAYFALLALGEIAATTTPGNPIEVFLLDRAQTRGGRVMARAWAALALGVEGAERVRRGESLGEDRPTAALLAMLQEIKDPERLAAYALAIGLRRNAAASDRIQSRALAVRDGAFRPYFDEALRVLGGRGADAFTAWSAPIGAHLNYLAITETLVDALGGRQRALADWMLAGPRVPDGFGPVPARANFATPTNPAIELVSMHARVAIAEQTATTEIEQVFRNRGTAPFEEAYVWPLPDDAAVSSFELWVDGKPVHAELLDRDRARAVYESIVRARRDPAILEWNGRGCVRAGVFPVPPNGEARVRLKFASVLAASPGTLEYLLPLRASALAPRGLASLVVEGTIESSRPLAAIYSPSHSVAARRDGEGRARFSMEATNVVADRDFTLAIGFAEGDFGACMLAHRRSGEEGTFVLTLAPRIDLETDRVMPKDVTFVIDTSGSMRGEKLDQAQRAVELCLARLRPDDRFSILRFSNEADAFRAEPTSPTPEAIHAARGWIDAFDARGGTNLDDALTRASEPAHAQGRLSLVFFVTDGNPTVGVVEESTILAHARARMTRGLRVFTVGVGSDVNTRLLDLLAEETRGARTYVLPGETIDAKVLALFDLVDAPVLTDVSVAFSGLDAHDVYPKRLGDLFRGSQLTLAGRYRASGDATVQVNGRVGDAPRTWTYRFTMPALEPRHESLRALWATRKVGTLLDEIRLYGDNRELVDEVKRIATEHAIVTPYTSFLVVEEGRRLGRASGYRGPADTVSPSTPSGPTTPAPAMPPGPQTGMPGGVATPATETDALLLALANAPTSGDAAVAGSVAISRLKSPSGPASPEFTGIGDGRSAPLVRRVGAKRFVLVGTTWIDAAFTDAARERLVKIPFLSDAYFELLRREPEIAAFLAVGERAIVEWKGAFYEIAPAP